MKKKMLLSCVLLLITYFSLQAQMSLPESYYVNKAKAQLRAASDKKGREAVIVATKDGYLYYVIRDGVKTDYFVEKRQAYVPRVPFRYEPPVEPPRKNPNDFAEMLQALYRKKFYLTNLTGSASGLEIYFFEKQW